jgi:hypothetical protein
LSVWNHAHEVNAIGHVVSFDAIREFGRLVAGEDEPQSVSRARLCKGLNLPEFVFMPLTVADA